MDNILLKMVGLALIGVVLTALAQKHTPDIALALGIFVTGGILFLGLDVIVELIRFIERLTGAVNLPEDIIAPVLKVTGIAIVTKITSDICRDAKETAMATGVEITGAVVGLYSALPLMNGLLDMVLSLK